MKVLKWEIFGIHSIVRSVVMVFVLHTMVGMLNVCNIIVVCHSMNRMRICNQSWPHVDIICFVRIFEQFMQHDYCCNCKYWQNYYIINWTHIVHYFVYKLYDQMLQLLSDVIWFMILLCCAISQTQWLTRLSGILEMCICIRVYYESMHAIDCPLMQHLLYTDVPVFAIQTFVILGIIVILLMKVYVFGVILSRYYNYYTFCLNYTYYHLVCIVLSSDYDNQLLFILERID